MKADPSRAALWLLPVAAVVVAAASLAHGFPAGHDWPFELVRVAEMREALVTRQRPPFWAPDLYFGFGSPVFLYYAPLYSWTAALLSMVTGSVAQAAVMASILFSVGGAVLMGWAVANLPSGNAIGARNAIVLMALQPYLLADAHVRNANAELAALSLLPAVLVGAMSIDARKRFWWTTWGLSAVILAHNLTALVAMALLLGIGIFVHRSIRALLPLTGGIVAALGVTAFFWWPAMILRPLMRSQDLLQGKFDFHRQFPPPAELASTRAFYSGGWLNLVLVILLLVAAVTLPRDDGRAQRALRACVIAVGVMICLLLRVSTPLWEHVPLLAYTQFPWRFVGPIVVVAILGCGIALSALARRLGARGALAIELLIVAIAALNAMPTLLSAPRLPWSALPSFEEQLTPDRVRATGIRTTVYDEYLPTNADPRLMSIGREPLVGVSRGLSARVLPASGGSAHIAVDGGGGIVLFRRWAYPVWSVTIDDRAATVIPAPGGVVAVQVPPGRHDVLLSLVEPAARTVAKIISSLTLAFLGGVAVWVRRRTGADQPPADSI